MIEQQYGLTQDDLMQLVADMSVQIAELKDRIVEEKQWDGKTERRIKSRSLSTHDEILQAHNQFLNLSDRISAHKKEFNERIDSVDAKVTKMLNVFFPQDGSDGLAVRTEKRIIELEKSKEQMEKHKNTMTQVAIGAVATISITIIMWIGKAVMWVHSKMAGG